jgi:secretion/DNA translocation related TadE-like protein
MMRGRCGSEQGSGSMLMIGVMTVVLFLSLGAICIAGYLVAAHRARTAADLAALSGASAVVNGDQACGAAERIAEANGAHLETCSRVGDPIDFVVSVRVEVTVGVRVPLLPRQIGAAAHAGSGVE